MKIEISDELYNLAVKMVQFMRSDGVRENVQLVDQETVIGWIEHSAEMYICQYLNLCESAWKGKEMFKELEAAYDKYNKPWAG